jgi:hypothetical protein
MYARCCSFNFIWFAIVSSTTKPDTFVNKIKRARRGKKGFGKALDKPNAAKVTEPKDTSTPKSSPERAIVKSKKS